ncbi:MAG: hypothetical protein IPK19_13945 [Chloroflexi bacterium]|nr:hypothetical protein [Chloroflexota bacterium]
MALGLFATGMPELLVIGALSVIILALTLVDLTRQNRPIDNPGETQEIELGTE